MKTRIGKIARLPQAIRAALNRRLADGESGRSLVDWLNSLEEVRLILSREFDGRPILEQNLSEWKQGGFREWQTQQVELEAIRALTAQANELSAAGIGLSTDRLALLLTARYAALLAATAHIADWLKPRNRLLLRELCEDLVALRRGDHSAERLKLEREELEIEKEQLRLAQEEQLKRTSQQWRDWAISNMDVLLLRCRTEEEKLRAICGLFFGDESIADYGKLEGRPAQSRGEKQQGVQTESNPIKP